MKKLQLSDDYNTQMVDFRFLMLNNGELMGFHRRITIATSPFLSSTTTAQ